MTKTPITNYRKDITGRLIGKGDTIVYFGRHASTTFYSVARVLHFDPDKGTITVRAIRVDKGKPQDRYARITELRKGGQNAVLIDPTQLSYDLRTLIDPLHGVAPLLERQTMQ